MEVTQAALWVVIMLVVVAPDVGAYDELMSRLMADNHYGWFARVANGVYGERMASMRGSSAIHSPMLVTAQEELLLVTR